MDQKCAACGGALEEIVTLGQIPVSGYTVETKELALTEPKFDLTLMRCENCKLIQLKLNLAMISKLEWVYKTYQSTYGVSSDIQFYMKNLIRELTKNYQPEECDYFVEIGCNDGTSLEIARNLGWKVFGVEPSKMLSESCINKKIPVINRFFDFEAADGIYLFNVRILLVRHVLEHVFNLKEFVSDLKYCMNETTILIIEVPSIDLIERDYHWEGIAHPHLYYFSLDTLASLLKREGIYIIKSGVVDSDGGSILVHATLTPSHDVNQNKNLHKLKSRIEISKYEIKHLLESFKNNGKIVYGFGAGKGCTILNSLNANSDLVKYVIDDDVLKQGNYLPGCGIKIVPSTLLASAEPDYLLMLAPTHTNEIKHKLSERFPDRKFKFVDLIPFIALEEE